MQIENILEILYGKRKDYKGTKIMRNLLSTNESFKDTIIEGIKTGNIYAWSDELWNKLDEQNFREKYNKVSDAFNDGHNLGRCLVYSMHVSYSFNNCCIAGGTVDYLKGTLNSKDGEHTWIERDGIIYDTTFMICINKVFLKKMKYIESYKTDPNKDPKYSAGKDFATDPFINSSRQR